MSDTIQSAPAGFFQGAPITNGTAVDLVSATADALAAAASASAAAATAETEAAAALTAATAAESSLASIGTSVTAAAASATAAASSATTAGTSATNAATSASAASTSASGASTSATTATGAASTATTQATNASASATAASGSASAASASASSASTSAASAASTLASAAPLASPALTGNPTAPTQTALNNSTRLATTAYTDAAVGVENTRALAAEALKAPLASPTFTGTPAAPTAAAGTNTTQLASTAFVVANGGGGNVGRNLLHNGEFLVNQRGTTATTNGAYSADRWLLELSTSTGSIATGPLGDADRTLIADEAAVQCLNCAPTGTAGAGDFFLLAQRIEGVQRYGGKSITVSGWVEVSSNVGLGIGALQHFGSGGSPSADVTVTATKVTLTSAASWTHFSVTLALPTTIGKTMGTTAGTDYTEIRLWMSSGATNNTLAGGIGVQSSVFKLWGLQAEIGTVATAFEKKSIVQHNQDCMRFFFVTATLISAAGGSNTQTIISFPVPMRASPTASGGGAGYAQSILNTTNSVQAQTTTSGQTMTFQADL